MELVGEMMALLCSAEGILGQESVQVSSEKATLIIKRSAPRKRSLLAYARPPTKVSIHRTLPDSVKARPLNLGTSTTETTVSKGQTQESAHRGPRKQGSPPADSTLGSDGCVELRPGDRAAGRG